MVKQAYKWTLEKAIDLSVKATAAAKKEGLYTVFFTIDGTRADMDFLLNLVDRVSTEGHMDAFTLVDTFGVLNPQAATLLHPQGEGTGEEADRGPFPLGLRSRRGQYDHGGSFGGGGDPFHGGGHRRAVRKRRRWKRRRWRS